jgi:hypothetical protein
MYRSGLADIVACPSIPPDPHMEYTYESVPAGAMPPLGHNMMMHLFEHPDHADIIPLLYRRVPKRLRARLDACPVKGSSLGWGIQYTEGIDWFVFFVSGCIGFVLCLILAIAWSAVKGDIQGGFAIAGFLLAFITFCGGVAHSEIRA